MKSIFVFVVSCTLALSALAKLPALSDEAKAKAAEAAAKTAHGGKTEAYLLCQWQDKTAAHYQKTAKGAKPGSGTGSCVDPGAFVYAPVVAAAPAPVVPAAAPAATPAVAAAAPVEAKK